MENKLITVFYFPEFLLTSGCLILLLIALFLKKEVFKKISYLSIILLFLVGLCCIKECYFIFCFLQYTF